MTYEIKLMYGTNHKEIIVENVSVVELKEGVYFLKSSERETLFTSPKEFVVYINQK